MIPSLHAHSRLPAAMVSCSWAAGWRALLLREYLDAPNQDTFTTAATPDHLFVLVTDGSCNIELLQGKQWRSAKYQAGTLAFTPPGTQATLRWRSVEPHRTIQMHMPFEVLARQSQELWDREIPSTALPSLLSGRDPLIAATLLALAQNVKEKQSDLYAETAVEFLGVHLLLRHGKFEAHRAVRREDGRLRRVNDYLRGNLAGKITLANLAREAGMSRYHMLRVFKKCYGETPINRLARMRMDLAKQHLANGIPVGDVAALCGYDDPANFATAFRRLVGVSASTYLARDHG